MKKPAKGKIRWVVIGFGMAMMHLSSSYASTLSECWKRASERSEFRYTPPGITVSIPPDIVFDYGNFRDGYMLLPAGVSPMKWYLVSEGGKGYELRFPEKSGTFRVQLPNGKSVRVRHGKKVSANSTYTSSFGKEFEEIAWGADGASAEDLRAVPVSDSNVMAAVEGELTRRIDGLAELYHSYGGAREDEGMNVSEAAYLDVLETCRKVSPAIAASADHAKADIQNQLLPAKSHPAGGKRPTRK